jgi:ring-1,2-phenylacetyl-CoA epoxidase subunit PaaD
VVATTAAIDEAWAVLETLSDPEIPVISLRDLGILREIRQADDGLEVIITPTYSGCPAMEQIHDDIVATLARHSIRGRVITRLSPAWTTDWMSAAGKEKLRAYGIAPPTHKVSDEAVVKFMPRAPRGVSISTDIVPCPRCASTNTIESSHFGSTACKALYRCQDCLETFDYFKPY